MRTTIPLLALAILLNSFSIFSQVVGGRTNSEQTPKNAEATKLSGGGFTGDVNHMTGEYNGTIPLGTVGTPAGLSFSLSLNYTSSFSFSTNMPILSGVPYGEGWSPNIPTISIETDVFHRFSKYDECNEENLVGSNSINNSSTDFSPNDEGDLYWFSPIISIPGVGSGRAVFKYIDVSDSKCAVFVLNKFESPVEIRFYGNTWTVKVADGTVYQFGTHLANYQSPSNDRTMYYDHTISTGSDPNETEDAMLSGVYTNPEKVRNAIEPKLSFSVWHCDLIYNQNFPLQGIKFEYEKYGGFNYFKEFQQSRYSMVNPQVFNTTTLPYSPDYIAYNDVFLKTLKSFVMESSLDILELEYVKQNNLMGGGVILDPTDASVVPYDALYSSQVIQSFGVSNNFTGWSRYPHRSSDLNYVQNDSNPFTDLNGNYKRETIASTNIVPFNHSFLESGRISNSAIYPGDIYELRSRITRLSGEDLQNGNGTLDLAIVTNNGPHGSVTLSNPTIVTASEYLNSRGLEIFSTFNMAMKWQMGWQQNELRTSNFFVMPNLPSTFDGFNIQIGPGNSDIDYSYHDIYLNDQDDDANALNCYPQTFGSRILKSGATVPSNFGTGHPWAMMVPIYAKMALQNGAMSGSLGSILDLFKNWWQDPNNPETVNIPTKFDNQVKLEEVELVRYSKNAYMLKGVKQYRINGEYSFYVPSGVNPPDGKKLVSQKYLDYDFKDEYVLRNYDYSNNDIVEIEENRRRRIIFLKSVSEVPVNGDLYAVNFNLPNPNVVLKTSLVYSKVINTAVSGDMIFTPEKPFAGLNKYLLTEYIDHLGGITKLEYYSAGSDESRVSNNYESIAGCNGMLYKKPFGTDRAYTMHMAVKYLMKNDEDDQLNPLVISTPNSQQLKRWEYVYDVASIIKNPKEIVLRPANSSDTAHFRSRHHMDVDVAFSKIRVYEPGLFDAVNSEYLRNYTDYEYYGGQTDIYLSPSIFPTEDEYLFYGKLKSSKTYDHYGVLHEEKFIKYGKTLAFQNGFERPNPWREQIGYYDDLLVRSYEYEDIYKNEVLTMDVPNGTGTITVSGPSAYSYLDIPSFDGKSGGIMESPKFLEFYFFEMLQPNNRPYMFDSYFIKKTSEIVRTYDAGLSKMADVVLPSIPASATKSANPFGIGVLNSKMSVPSEDSLLILSIHQDLNASLPTLINQSPLSDIVLFELLTESGIRSDKKAEICALQNGLSNEIWIRLINDMKEYSPLSMDKIIATQPYFSDTILFHLINNSSYLTNDIVYQNALLKNPYLSDTVVKALLNASEIPGESFSVVLEKQTQFTEPLLKSIISSPNLRDAHLVSVLKNQLLTNSLCFQILDLDKYSESSIVSLIESTIAYPSDKVLQIILRETPLYQAASMRRILAAADREIGLDVLNMIDTLYSKRDAASIKPPAFIGNRLNQYCQNPVLTSRTFIENKTEYEYYEANDKGEVIGKPFELLLGHISNVDQASSFPKTVNLSTYGLGSGTRTIGALRLKHEPSWQLFSTKQSSPHLPGVYQRQEYFYWYDLQNRYDRYWFNFDNQNTNLEVLIHSYGTGGFTDTLVTNLNWHLDFQNQGGVPILPQIDGMERSRTYGNRVIAFQKSTFSKNATDLKPLMQSEYYDYDRRWEFDDLPKSATTVYYEGPACSNTPPQEGCLDLIDCTDCYYFKYTTEQALIANVPLNHCAWSLYGNVVICPIGQSPIEYYPGTEQIYCNVGISDVPYEGNKAMDPGAVLANTLQLRSIIIQLDTIHNSQDDDFYIKRLDPKNKYIVDFYMGGSEEEDVYGFENPIEMLMPFDNLNVRTILERNRYLQPELEKNQVDLKTRYYYNQSENTWNVNTTCPSEGAYNTIVNTDIGLPVRITVGWDRIEGDSLATQYEYNEIGLVNKVIEPSGKFTEFTFDDYWRMTSVEENNNRLLLTNEYHTWDKNNSLTFTEKTNQNFVLNRVYNGADLTNEINTEYIKGFVDPLGREHSSIRAYKLGDKYMEIHSGTLSRDNWSRTIDGHKNHLEVIIPSLGGVPLEMIDNNNLAYSSITYENNPKSRAKRNSNFGVDINDIHVVKSNYAIANNIFTSCELGLNVKELQMIMGTGSTNMCRFYRTEVFDQDNKVNVQYINSMGQKVATLSYSENNLKIVTLFVYDSYGNLTRVINPEKQQAFYSYNMIGQLVKEQTVDAGKKSYMYNKQGLVSVMQDESGNKNSVSGVSRPYFRVFVYDDFGRLLSSGRTDQAETNGKYPLYNSQYHPLLYETKFVGLGPNQPTNIGGQEFYFDYVFTNISTQDWLANYKGMVGAIGGGGMLYYTISTLTDFNSVLTSINPILWEKETFYGSDALVSSIGKVIQTNSFDNDGEIIQRVKYFYDVNDNLAQEIIQFHPLNLGINPLSPPSDAITSVISYPKYNYRNSVLEQKVDVDNNGIVDIHYFNEYDALNRLKTIYAASEEVNDISSATKLMSYAYDDANGLLIQKIQHVMSDNGLLDVTSINYTFDIRDRLKEINGLHTNAAFMEYELFYDNDSPMYFDGITEIVGHHQNWNGNINGSLMQYDFSSASNPINNFQEPTLYGFKYDKINRLTIADATVGDLIVTGTSEQVM
ncbi:MAG: hypothetical protein K9G37_02410, partial [Crocinitomicaceae bacterium]|nr:hypothetical protein [Crocinitomicaceae bacterium]